MTVENPREMLEKGTPVAFFGKARNNIAVKKF